MTTAMRAVEPRTWWGRMRSLVPSVRRTAPWTDAILVVALMALALATYPMAVLVIDSGRDLAWALAIARGEEFPFYGPGLNNLWKLGPVWFYLLAIPLGLTGSIGVTAFCVGLLAAAKIPLAYALGRQWREPALGLSFAAAIALPGWSTFGQLVLLHTAVVETAVLATLGLALCAWQRRHAVLALASALALGLAVHAHPTALVAAPAVSLALARVAITPARWTLWPMALLAFALPFTPMLFAETSAGWPQWGATAGYFGDSDYGARLARAPAVLWGASVGAVTFVREFLLPRWPLLGGMVGAALLALYALAAVGCLREARRERGVLLLLGFAALAWIFVLLLRDRTPEWMTYACSCFGAALLAVGWLGIWPGRCAPSAARALAAFALVVSGALLVERVLAVRSGLQALPAEAIDDIALPPKHDSLLRFWFPAWAHDALAIRLCAVGTPIALHGDLATAFHFGQGVATGLHCDATQEVRLAGNAPRQLAGVPRDLAKRLRLVGTLTAWGYLLSEPTRILHPARGERIAPHTRYLMDDYLPRLGRDVPQTIRLSAACQPRDVLVVTNLLPLLNAPFEVRMLQAQALPVVEAQTIASWYFSCPRQGRFAFELLALEPRAADVFVLRRD